MSSSRKPDRSQSSSSAISTTSRLHKSIQQIEEPRSVSYSNIEGRRAFDPEEAKKTLDLLRSSGRLRTGTVTTPKPISRPCDEVISPVEQEIDYYFTHLTIHRLETILKLAAHEYAFRESYGDEDLFRPYMYLFTFGLAAISDTRRLSKAEEICETFIKRTTQENLLKNLQQLLLSDKGKNNLKSFKFALAGALFPNLTRGINTDQAAVDFIDKVLIVLERKTQQIVAMERIASSANLIPSEEEFEDFTIINRPGSNSRV